MAEKRVSHIPPMPEGFTDQAAWDAIHWQFKPIGADESPSFMDGVVIEWQRANQERVRAAIRAVAAQLSEGYAVGG